MEDKGREKGTIVSQDVFTTDPDTLFPLQGALGYDLAQHLFVGPNNLVMEGTSDLTYFVVLSDHLKELGRASLDPKWSAVPVAGADMIPTFVALLGHRLDVTVVIDARKQGNQRLARLVNEGYLSKKRLITIGEITGAALADVEDLFAVDDYLLIYNAAFGATVKPSDLTGSDQIVNKIARHIGVERFDHGRPADTLLRRRDELLPKLREPTLKNFEDLFTKVNATLSAK